MRLPDAETVFCLSIAEHPGKSGTRMHNAAYEALGLNYIYVPRLVMADELHRVIKNIKKGKLFNIRGVGVSMPHKTRVMQYLDAIDPVAEKVGSVNTIVNDEGKLTGYNTDYYGILQVLKDIPDIENLKVHVLGTGGMGKAVIYALKEAKVRDIIVFNHKANKGKRVAAKSGVKFEQWDKRLVMSGDVLINATPVGMLDAEAMPVLDVSRYSFVIDAVINPQTTRLIREALESGKVAVPGQKIALYQAAKQFELYTGQKAPLEVMQRALEGN